ncbi:hypothetical protein MNBD_GAMMA08-556 [hydrothermal vent metagenome]|uniref:Type IV pilus biogenesis protein PilE n=1 Tax=hydrothermal vent metagenome TaxID=652676 RepID=A0A3B0XRV4_9ZZZZ
MNKQMGFTLVELMIVVAIVGVLTTIGIISYGSFTAKSERDRGCVMILPEMARDLELYKQVNGVYPANFGQLNSVLKSSREWFATPVDSTLKRTYTLVPGNSGLSFTLSCIPTDNDGNAITKDESDCGVLTYDNFGRKGVVGELAGSAKLDTCWR